MARYGISNNTKTITFPAMNAVTALLFFFTKSNQLVVFNDTINNVLGINSKKSIFQPVVFYDNIPAAKNFNSTEIFQAGHA